MRNAAATREKILEAATKEFSAYGIAGARVHRIAQAANCNKNLIYVYFESKEKLFATVLKKNLTRGYESVPFTPDDLPGYAVRVFDFSMKNPDLLRLMAWFGLEQKVESPPERGASKQQKIAAMEKAQKSGRLGNAFHPGFLLTAILALANAWTPVNAFGPSLDPEALKRPEVLRRNLAEAVRLLASANNPG